MKAQSARLKSRAVELLPRGLRTPAGGGILLIGDDEDDEGDHNREVKGRGEKYKRDVEREVERIKLKVSMRSPSALGVADGFSPARGESDQLVEIMALSPDSPYQREDL